ncbi:hypothetical protein E2C01_088517 [Portunus trituberculatus]|uniref:Secreted protein n=1 Tax=Portunus trituberculatus TaxID=210409 RepID=A0A5B7J6E2_PORTR|nr:hypothetical protein [Portunus trituberculatus]
MLLLLLVLFLAGVSGLHGVFVSCCCHCLGVLVPPAEAAVMEKSECVSSGGRVATGRRHSSWPPPPASTPALALPRGSTTAAPRGHEALPPKRVRGRPSPCGAPARVRLQGGRSAAAASSQETCAPTHHPFVGQTPPTTAATIAATTTTRPPLSRDKAVVTPAAA